MSKNSVLAIILAAGKGSRMKQENPKPLTRVYNKPIISWIIDSFRENNVDIAVVINPIHKHLFNSYENIVEFVYQKEQKGTGHAVIQASEIIKNYDYVYVFVGDSPFVKSETMLKMLSKHINDNSDATILSSIFDSKEFPYARIVRNRKGNIEKIIEEVNASDKELEIEELFGSHYLFKSKILSDYLPRLKKNPKNGEIYFTDILNELIKDNKSVNVLNINDWKRLVGLNTKEDIKWAESQRII